MIEHLKDRISTVRGGRALDLGAGDGQFSCWLADQGFVVDAVDHDPTAFTANTNAVDFRSIRFIQQDFRAFEFPPSTYAVVIASSVLHYLRPSELQPLIDRILNSLIPGGLLACQVLTRDDPEYTAFLAEGRSQIDVDTFPILEEGVIHYFASGELLQLCDSMEILHYMEERHSYPGGDGGYRAWAVLLARKPTSAPE